MARKTSPAAWVAAIIATPILLFCMGLTQLLELGWILLAGWWNYLTRTLPRVQIDWGSVATAVFWISLFAVGTHSMCRWFHGSLQSADAAAGLPLKRWRLRWTAMLVGLVVFLFSAGTAAVCVAHQVGFLATAETQMFETRDLNANLDTEGLRDFLDLHVGIKKSSTDQLWWHATIEHPRYKPLLDRHHLITWEDSDGKIAGVILFHRDPALRAEHGIVVAIGDRTVVRSADQLDEVLKLVPTAPMTRPTDETGR